MSIKASFELIDGCEDLSEQLGFEPMLYNQQVYVECKDYVRMKTFIARAESGLIVARIRFAKRSGSSNWESLPLAPYGGLEMVDGFEAMTFFRFISDQLGTEGPAFIKVSEIHNDDLADALNSAGFVKSIEDINHHVDLSAEVPIHGMELRRKNKAVKAGCTFSVVPMTTENTPMVHQFIGRCRQQQGLEINISEDDLLKSVKAMPAHYETYVIKLDGEIIAAAVTVRVTSKIVYNYLPASDKGYNHLSPMVMLMIQLYEELKIKGYSILDWGLTSIDGHIQKGLADFKEAMGAQRTTRYVYALE